MDYLYALQCIRESAPNIINYFFLFISEASITLAPVIAGIIYWCVSKEDGSYILMGFTGTYTMNQLLKNTFCIYRPWIQDSRLHVAPLAKSSATGYSFPSGHTSTAAAIYGGIGLYQRKRKVLAFLAAALVLLVAFSRNWLGAHTMKDVLTAIFLAALVLCLVNVLRYHLTRKPQLDTPVTIIGCLVSLALLVFLKFKNYPLDYFPDGSLFAPPYDMITECFSAAGSNIGFLTGWWLERHFVKFETKSETKVQRKALVLRGFFGLLLIALPFFTSEYLFSFAGEHINHFIKYFLLFFITMYVYPLIFTKISKKKACKNV